MLRKIQPDERYVFHYDEETRFFYRRIGSKELRNLRNQHMKRGRVHDSDSLGLDIVNACLIGWEGYVDEHDEPVPFNPEEIEKLPDPVLAELVKAICTPDGQVAEKNSQGKSRPVPKS